METSGKPGQRVRVINGSFRVFHVFLVIGTLFLAYSSLGLDDGDGVVTAHLSMFYLHRYIGLIWGAMVVAYGLSRAYKRHFTILEPLGKPIIIQIKEGFSIIGRYFFGRQISRKVRSNMGRHNVLASYAFLMLLFGLLLLAVGGIGLILSPRGDGFNELYLGIHVAGAALLALFVLAHFFAVMNRENWPLLRAVFTDGKVREKWMEEKMPTYTRRN